MSQRERPSPADRDGPRPLADRWHAVDLDDDGEIVVYDKTNHHAWVQSKISYTVEQMQ